MQDLRPVEQPVGDQSSLSVTEQVQEINQIAEAVQPRVIPALSSRKMKYVIFDDSMVILFTLGQQHGDFKYLKPTSAGFCKIWFENEKFGVSCYGESVSLDLKPAVTDEWVIGKMLNEY